MDTIVGVADEGYHLPFAQAGALHLLRVDEKDLASTFYAAKPVAKAVDRRVELIVAPHGEQTVPTGYILEACRTERLRNSEFCLTAFCLPYPLACGIAAVKATGREHARLEIVKFLRISFCNQIADQPVIVDPFIPFHPRIRRQRCFGYSGDNSGLGFKVLACRCPQANRALNATECILDADD